MRNLFLAIGETTKAEIAIHYSDEAQLQRHLEMGFEAGFDMALNTFEGIIQVDNFIGCHFKPSSRISKPRLARISTNLKKCRTKRISSIRKVEPRSESWSHRDMAEGTFQFGSWSLHGHLCSLQREERITASSVNFFSTISITFESWQHYSNA